tara:strand:+ start:1035 stop:1703 length:669 start_codon:yes stop_codon:yes gene_type:complete
MKVLIISKDNIWTRKLIHLLWVNEKDYKCTYTTVCDEKLIDELKPDWVFFFHWSDIVSKEIYDKYKCVVIHTGRLPKDRGGSPLQNQIIKGVTHTRVNAIEMKEKVDSGAIYYSLPITLQGNITDVWLSIADTAYNIINYCVINNPEPIPQNGDPMVYKRIRDNSIKLDSTKDILYIYDQIRMVDDIYYPNAYLDIGEYRLEFSRAKLNNKEILADVKIRKK